MSAFHYKPHLPSKSGPGESWCEKIQLRKPNQTSWFTSHGHLNIVTFSPPSGRNGLVFHCQVTSL